VLQVAERLWDGRVVTPDARTGDRLDQRQRLGAELRRVRELSGRSGRELAQRIGISQSKVSRAESGSALLSMPEVAAWASATQASPDVADRLSALTEAAYAEVRNWDSALGDRSHIQGDIQTLEERARQILTFQSSVVPGLLQTAEYARRVFGMVPGRYPQDAIPAVVAARLDRQLALFAGEQRFEFLITEAALRWRPGPAALLCAQLDRIASLSTLDNVSVGLIPLSVEAVTNTSHGFALLDMAERGEGDATVLVETIHANLVVTDPESTALYRARWSLLKQMAVYGDEARAFLAIVASGLRKGSTLIRQTASRRQAGDAAITGRLHPRRTPGQSVEVEHAGLGASNECLPFVSVDDDHLVRVLGAPNSVEFQFRHFHARAAALADANEVHYLVQRGLVHWFSLSCNWCGIPAPSIRTACCGHVERDLIRAMGRELLFPCTADRSCARESVTACRGGERPCASACSMR
jgi:transcriptional regulator with XRE-family HTH domain